MNKSSIFLFLFLVLLIFSCKPGKIKYTGIERTLYLLNSSTEEKPNNVEIFFYGQSIVGGMKSNILIDSLQKKFPNAKISYTHKPIGGFTIPKLISTIDHDLLHENPDLVIFHAYDGIKDGLFDSLVKKVRKRISSDILLFDHHYVWDVPESKLIGINKSHDFDSKEIEKIANKYNCAFVNLREQWKNYLDKNNIGANELMGNTINPNVHPNKKGNELLRQLILKKFNQNNNSYDIDIDSLREVFNINKKTNTLFKKFSGNRLELELVHTKKETSLEIFIDGKRPSEILGSYHVSRPSKAYQSWMPAIKKVSFGEVIPLNEKWEITVYDINRAQNTFKYDLNGVKSGFDGQGSSESDFISSSGRIVIKKEDFLIFEIEKITKKETPNNFKISFEVKKLVNDTIIIGPNKTNYTLFREHYSSNHKLNLNVIDGDVFIKKLKSYKPYLNN